MKYPTNTKRKRLISRLSLTAIIVLCGMIVAHTNSSNIAYKERYIARQADSLALAELYHKTNGENWKIPWDLTAPLHTWYGITLCRLERSVTAIDLDGLPDNTAKKNGGNGLKGELPDLRLPFLVKLYLGNNDLTDTIPNFNHLRKVSVICLSSNNLLGQIPTFSNLINLERLELDYNALEGSIPDFTNCPKLRFLYLPDNKLSGTIPSFDTKKLEVLLLNNNQFSGNVPDLSLCKKLKYLRVNNNQLSGTIPTFNYFKKLNKIDLSHNDFDDMETSEGMRKITHFNVSHNRLGFDDLLPNKQYFASFKDYENQEPIQYDTLIFKELGIDYFIQSQDNVVAGNNYFWYKNEDIAKDGNTDNLLEFNALDDEDSGFYRYQITNDQLPGLALQSGIITLHVEERNEELSEEPLPEEMPLIFSGRITPNGDGKNDVFMVTADTGILNLELSQLEIYTANGQLVYQAAPYQNNWRGTLMNSQNPLPAGAYFYRFVPDKTKNISKSGTVMIIK